MPYAKCSDLPLSTMIGNILEQQLDQFNYTELHPLIIHLGDDGVFHVMSLTHQDVLDPTFGSIALGVSRLASMSLNANQAILCLPCYRKGSGRLTIKNAIDIAEDPGEPKYIALCDDGQDVSSYVYSIKGKAGQPLIAMPDIVRPEPSYFTALMKAWSVEGRSEAGVLTDGDTEGMEAEDGSFEWSNINDLYSIH